MIKQEANNSFAEGLMMDLNPLITPNTVMTNCLNGTLVTFNGNEYMLQNDMGNGRVETAFLPEGYIPMGTCELGGIIYIVSYNPLQGTCQVGSFPSPERNITSDERESAAIVQLTESDFQWKGSVDGAGVYYLKKDLDSTLQFYPGDKFIVYSNNIQANETKLSGLATDKKKETLRLSLGTVTSDGKLVVFDTDTLKKFNVGSGKYHIKEHTGGSSSKVDLDDYRDLVSQPYNIFNSKVSGTLVLIAELVQFSSFGVNISHHFTNNSADKKYSPLVSLEFSGSYDYVPYGIQKKFTLIDKDGKTVATGSSDIVLQLEAAMSHTVGDENLLDGTDVLSKLPNNYFNQSEREIYTLNYELIPCMIWGPVKHLAVKGSIALDKIGSGFIDLSAWKYYNSDSKCNLTWGLEVYEEEDKKVKDVSITFTKLTSPTTTQDIVYTINKKSSYHGTFYELIPFDKPYYKLKDSGGADAELESNTLYLAKIEVKYGGSDANVEDESRVFYRWLYTNSVFNDYFYNELDYKDLYLDMFKTALDFQYEVKSKTSDGLYQGFIRGEKPDGVERVEAKKTLCAIQTYKENVADCTLKVSLENDYNTFRIKTNSNSLNVKLKDNSEHSLTVDSTIKYTDREDSEMETILRNEILSDWDGEEKELPPNATSIDTTSEDKFIGEDAEYGNGLKVITTSVSPTYNSAGDFFKFDLDYRTITIAKAYATMSSTTCQSKGRVVPLAYDNETFEDYGLEFNGTSWVPLKLGTFGFKEDGGKKGRCYIGYLTQDEFNYYHFVESNDVDFNWTGDSGIIAKQQGSGWNSVLMFVVHHCTDSSNPRQTFLSRSSINQTSYNGFKTTEDDLSHDSCNNTTGNVVFILMKSNVDDYYYPINCAKKSNASGYSSYVGSNWSSFYKHMATVLNNLFRYTDEATTKSYFLPNYIYYGDDYVYNVNILLEASLNDASKGTVQLVLGNDQYVDINSNIINLFAPSIAENKKSDLVNNVTATISDTLSESPQSLHIVSKDSSSGISLRNLLLDQQISNLGVIVCGYDGQDSGVSINSTLDKKSIYCLNNGIPELATKFKPVQLNYSGGAGSPLVVTATKQDLYSSGKTININRNYVLNDNGLMIVKDPPKSELTVRRNGKHDKGYVYGYIKRGLSPDYEFWK